MKDSIRKEKFSNQACRYIEDKIISGEYKDGDRLVETKIAKELGISQSPVREALRELEVMGFVEIKPYSGCFVRSVDEKKLYQIYSLRTLLECYAVRESIADISDEAFQEMEDILQKMREYSEQGNRTELARYDVAFHSLIVESAHDSMLEKMWKLVGAPQWTKMAISSYADLSYFPESHQRLFDLAKKHDLKGLEKELQDHFRGAAKMVTDNAIIRLSKKVQEADSANQ